MSLSCLYHLASSKIATLASDVKINQQRQLHFSRGRAFVSPGPKEFLSKAGFCMVEAWASCDFGIGVELKAFLHALSCFELITLAPVILEIAPSPS